MWQKRDVYKICIYFLQWLAISDKRPRSILVEKVFRIVHSRMCKKHEVRFVYIFRPMKKLTQLYIRTWNWWYSDIASSTNRKCSLNWKFRHPERKSYMKENSTRHVFFCFFSPGFSVKFAHFSQKTPMECVYVCLL
jgi:hypothetical protein